MGSGMTTDRLFGGINLAEFDSTRGGSGKLEYLVLNSFMNHEFVIMEEMMDAPDYILEQLKDILSSGKFRNGSQEFDIKTRYIVCCTNKTREEFTKNDSLRALMERFPLEHNVVWDNYNETTYNTLLEKRFGAGHVDPIIPFLLQQYVKAGVTISPRIALDAYLIFETCGPDSLIYIADFAKKKNIISDALKKFESTIKFKTLAVDVEDLCNELAANPGRSNEKMKEYIATYTKIVNKQSELARLTVIDDLAKAHAGVYKKVSDHVTSGKARYTAYIQKLENPSIEDLAKKKKASRSVEEILEDEYAEDKLVADKPF